MSARRRMLNVDALADYLGQTRDWSRRSLADGTIPGGRKVRGRWMVAQEDVDAWIDAGRPARPETVPYAPFPRKLTRTVDR
jgi:hypothetical protein